MTRAAGPTRPENDVHVRARIEDFLAHRLGREAEIAFEAHILVCDECFSAYFVRTVDDL